MAGETKFTRMKRAVDDQKRIKMQAEAVISARKEENQRIFQEIKENFNIEISSIEEGEAVLSKLRETITNDAEKMEQLLKEEGIVF